MFKLPILMPEEYWANNQLSVARYCGGVRCDGKVWYIVNKDGITIHELSNPKSKHYVGDGNKKAIEPGEPADLVREDWIPVYRILGREKVIELVKEGKELAEIIDTIDKKLLSKVKREISKFV